MIGSRTSGRSSELRSTIGGSRGVSREDRGHVTTTLHLKDIRLLLLEHHRERYLEQGRLVETNVNMLSWLHAEGANRNQLRTQGPSQPWGRCGRVAARGGQPSCPSRAARWSSHSPRRATWYIHGRSQGAYGSLVRGGSSWRPGANGFHVGSP